MEDFKMVINYLFNLLSIEIPVFSYRISFLSIFLSLSILSIVIGFVIKIFGGDD